MFSFNANSTRSKTFCGGKCIFSLVQPEIFCFNAFRYLMSGHCDFFFFPVGENEKCGLFHIFCSRGALFLQSSSQNAAERT